MRLIFTTLKNIKNTLPYLLLISIYFFFVNLEAKKDKNSNLDLEDESITRDYKSVYNEKTLRITIPVIPYEQ